MPSEICTCPRDQTTSTGTVIKEYVLLSALQHIFASLKRTRDQKLSSGLMSSQLSSAITGLMLLTFTTTHLLTSRPTLRSRSPCASWAPPLHRGLVRESLNAPHHHDPNEMLPNFAFWVMVAAPSCLHYSSGLVHFMERAMVSTTPNLDPSG